MASFGRRILVAVSRLVFFLTTISWLCGQWFYVFQITPPGRLTLCKHGWLIETSDLGRWKLNFDHVDEVSAEEQMFIDWRFNTLDPADDRQGFLTSFYFESSNVSSVPGIVEIDTPFMHHYSIAIRHWVVSVVAAIALLIVVFCKRKQSPQPTVDENAR